MIHKRFAKNQNITCRQLIYIDLHRNLIECGMVTEKMYASRPLGCKCYLCASIFHKDLLKEDKIYKMTSYFRCPALSCKKDLTFRQFVEKDCCEKAYFTNDFGYTNLKFM